MYTVLNYWSHLILRKIRFAGRAITLYRLLALWSSDSSPLVHSALPMKRSLVYKTLVYGDAPPWKAVTNYNIYTQLVQKPTSHFPPRIETHYKSIVYQHAFHLNILNLKNLNQTRCDSAFNSAIFICGYDTPCTWYVRVFTVYSKHILFLYIT